MFHPGWLVFHREYRGIKDLISWEHHHILYHDLTMDFFYHGQKEQQHNDIPLLIIIKQYGML